MKQRTAPLQVGQDEPDVIETAWFVSYASDFITAPPHDDNLDNPTVGDVFLHFATKYSPPIYQLWIRLPNGTPVWRLVEPGYARADGYVLIVTQVTKEASWVKEAQYKAVMRAEARARSKQ